VKNQALQTKVNVIPNGKHISYVQKATTHILSACLESLAVTYA